MGPTVLQNRRHDDSDVGAAIPLRATVFPLQLFPSLLERHLDVGVGYQAVVIADHGLVHGPHLEVAYLTSKHVSHWLDWLGDPPRPTRLGVHVQAHGLLPSSAGMMFNPGVTLQLSLENYAFTDTDFMGCQQSDSQPDDPRWESSDDDSVVCGTGYAWGETTVGFFVEGSYSRVELRNLWWVGAGLKVRLPATIGVGFVMGDLWSDN